MSDLKRKEPPAGEVPPAQGGRSMRQRKKVGPYIDDDPNLVAALEFAEQDHRLNTRDEEAARTAGFMPAEMCAYERSCCAVPDKLKHKPDRFCSIRNHMLFRAQKTPSKFLPLTEAVRGLGASFGGAGKDAGDAAAVYNCLHHHGAINAGVLEDHTPRKILAPNGKPLPRQAAYGAGVVVAPNSASLPPAAAAGGAAATRLRVVVVGAGAAGLSAARQT